jgi:hypothetical protein
VVLPSLDNIIRGVILKHVPAKRNPVRQGEPLFADKDMR